MAGESIMTLNSLLSVVACFLYVAETYYTETEGCGGEDKYLTFFQWCDYFMNGWCHTVLTLHSHCHTHRHIH